MKIKLFYPGLNYFVNDVYREVNDSVKGIVFERLPRILKSIKRRSNKVDKIKFIDQKVMEFSTSFNLERFDSLFDYNIDVGANDYFISESTIFELIEGNSESKKEKFTCFTEELIDVAYSKAHYDLVLIDDSQEYLDKFNELNNKLINEIINFTLYDYLIGLKENLNNNNDVSEMTLEVSNSSYNKTNILKWYGAKSELIELTKALIENGNLKGKQEDIFNEVQKVFGIELKNIDQGITKFNTRNQENETKFLDTLKTSLSKYIKSKLEKKR